MVGVQPGGSPRKLSRSPAVQRSWADATARRKAHEATTGGWSVDRSANGGRRTSTITRPAQRMRSRTEGRAYARVAPVRRAIIPSRSSPSCWCMQGPPQSQVCC